jgi:hypothetical protein
MRRAQAFDNNATIANNGEVHGSINARLPRLLLLLSAGLDAATPRLQVISTAAGTTIINTGTAGSAREFLDHRVWITARIQRHNAPLKGLDASRAGRVAFGKRHHGVRRGQSRDPRARPASTTPARPHAEESKTQAESNITVLCYDKELEVSAAAGERGVEFAGICVP